MTDTRIEWDERRGLASFARYQLDTEHLLFEGWLPPSVLPGPAEFEDMWNLHPEGAGTAAWKQAFGCLEPFPPPAGPAPPLPPVFEPLVAWVQQTLDHRLNGILVRWYDAEHKHMRPRRLARRTGLVPQTPLVLVSLGATRTFRLRPAQGVGFRDFQARNGTIFVLPSPTHVAWTYEVPHHARDKGRRIALGFQAVQG